MKQIEAVANLVRGGVGDPLQIDRKLVGENPIRVPAAGKRLGLRRQTQMRNATIISVPCARAANDGVAHLRRVIVVLLPGRVAAGLSSGHRRIDGCHIDVIGA